MDSSILIAKSKIGESIVYKIWNRSTKIYARKVEGNQYIDEKKSERCTE